MTAPSDGDQGALAVLVEVWSRATAVQPPADQVVVLGTGVAVLVCLGLPSAWHVARHGLTVVHEGSHALVALLSGRRLAGVRLHRDTSGLTVSVGRPDGPGMVATAFAGYVGPSALGVAAAALLGRGYAVGLLWGLLLALALLLLQIRNLYGLVVLLLGGGALAAVSWWAPVGAQVAVAYLLTWFLLLGAPRAVVELGRTRRRPGSGPASDADVLARLTPLPAVVWLVAFWLVTTGAAVLGGWWIVTAAQA